ncbi:hypothetical protein CDAR_62271 [Caerostris darwini]|uniref:Integrase catalytic domain-containing protein n=1 Tax=Caerostris darwini TaxID=1538125 RepID=A0AAV4UPZ5_9ARAC|nr:hypothetical protein CDAR_62271 [Caerostris darwini]
MRCLAACIPEARFLMCSDRSQWPLRTFPPMNEVYEKLGISKQQTLSYNPQGNGQVERLSKTLIDDLNHLVWEKQEDYC